MSLNDSPGLAYKARDSGIVDWKSTVIHDLLTLLIVDVLFNHFIRNSAGANRQISASPKMSTLELLALPKKLLVRNR